ncbi:MAG: AAA family ATPase [Evtepia sp.]
MGSVIVIASGKGGTGKTSLTAGIGSALAMMGRTVLCIDTDVGLRNLDLAFGMSDVVLMDFADVMEGRCKLGRAAVPHPAIPNLYLLTAPVSSPREPLRADLFQMLLQEAREKYDYTLIDAPAGIGAGLRFAACDADRAIIVATDDAYSLRDAQRVVTKLSPGISNIRLVVNRVSPKMMRRIGSTIDDAMDSVGLPLLGIVPEDPRVTLSANGKLLSGIRRKGAVTACQHIAGRITGQRIPLMKIR